MEWTNSITKALGIQYPIIQAPMFGVTTPEMVAAAANAGCLGSLSVSDLPTDKCIELIRATRKLTKVPFSVNIFVYDIPEITESLRSKYAETKRFIEDLARRHNLSVNLPEIDQLKIHDYPERVDALIAEGCKVVSFTFGNLNSQSIKKFKDNGIILIGTCTSVDEAMILEKSGIDIICVQGLEAGGHRGSLQPDNILKIGGLSLLSQVYETVKVPIIYTGGIYNARTLLSAKMLGAKGFQVGSILLCSAESAFKDFEKTRLRSATEKDIMLTRSFSGRYARGIRNAFIEAMEDSGHILPFPYQNKLTGELRKVAKANNNSDFVNIWVGQSLHEFSSLSTGEILKELIDETEKLSLK